MSYPMMMMPQMASAAPQVLPAKTVQQGGAAVAVIGIIVFYFLYRRLIKPWWQQVRIVEPKTWIPDPYSLQSVWWNQFRFWNPSTWFVTDAQITGSA
jgi:hypothetical protein